MEKTTTFLPGDRLARIDNGAIAHVQEGGRGLTPGDTRIAVRYESSGGGCVLVYPAEFVLDYRPPDYPGPAALLRYYSD
jgi:hypothetical protein